MPGKGTEFLSGELLSKRIRNLLKQKDIKCAVAFWGDGADKQIEYPETARIICDLSMGGTNPEVLRKLGAPENSKIRELSNLHAKVYLSPTEAIIASANISNNGVGFIATANLIETGIAVPASSNAYVEASSWFDEQYRSSKKVTRTSLKRANAKWKKRQKLGWQFDDEGMCPTKNPIENVVKYPHLLNDVFFVFSTSETDKETREKVFEITEGETSISISRKNHAVFSNWEISEFPKDKFINFHRTRKKIYTYFWETRNRVEEEKSIVCKRLSKSDIPETSKIGLIVDRINDHADYLDKVFAEYPDGVVLSPTELSDFFDR